MLNWLKSGLVILLLVSASPLLAQGPVAPSETETDSLVWYVEQLERDLAGCEIRHEAVEDSLQIRLEFAGYKLELAEGQKRHWYDDPKLWFLMGAAGATLVMATTLKITF